MNRIYRVKLTGGIIGALTSDPKKKLDIKVAEINNENFKVVQIIPDATPNLLIIFGRIILLVITLLFYTKSTGYLIITEENIE